MNRVGDGGKGESVWLGFFLIAVLRRFAPLARQRSNPAFAELCESEAARLRDRIDASSWDGQWYRRAYFDSGAPLGAAGNVECKIDSIAQSWAVLSGASRSERAERAMHAVERHLLQRENRLVQLLAPPFDTSRPSPGYIQGYVPGVRENGGQYTHGALWVAFAYARLGDAERAWELFSILNPLHHASSPERAATYRIEPYVIAGDVYASPPHIGRGGWSWYTGSAGWCYRLIVEELLGFRRRGERLELCPLLPADWPGYSMRYRHGTSCYEIDCRRAASAADARLMLDGADVKDVTLTDDGATHAVVATVWREPAVAGAASATLASSAAAPPAGPPA
jgi:cellobiose phosphorylase